MMGKDLAISNDAAVEMFAEHPQAHSGCADLSTTTWPATFPPVADRR